MNFADSFAAELDAFKALNDHAARRERRQAAKAEISALAMLAIEAGRSLRTGKGPCEICGSPNVYVSRRAELVCDDCGSTLTVYD